MKTFNAQYEYLMSRRVSNVQNHITTHVNGFWAYKPGDRIVKERVHMRDPIPDYMRTTY